MLAIKNNLEDRLVNGLVGRVMGFKSTRNTFNVVYIKFNDKKAEQIAINASQIYSVPTSFPIRAKKIHPSIKTRRFK